MLKVRAVNMLNKISAHILEEPKRLDMNSFGEVYGDTLAAKSKSLVREHAIPHELPACRTQGCIAGWGIFLTRPSIWKSLFHKVDHDQSMPIEDAEPFEENTVHEVAMELIGLTDEQAKQLFYFKGWVWNGPEVGWPAKFAEAYNVAKSAKQRAKVTVARIKHFIDTDGRE